MENILNTRIIQIFQPFVNVIEVGLDNFVQFNMFVIVHLIQYILVFLPAINLYAFVRLINMVLDVFLPTLLASTNSTRLTLTY
jgi:hypothetical protein